MRKGLPLDDLEVSVTRDASDERKGTYRLSVETTAPTTDVAANYTTTANVVADGALYAAKRDGRGRAVLVHHPP